MITRPLDIASHLQPPPRSFDALFYINGGVLALFLMFFGSRFVLAPGVDLQLPEVPGAVRGAALTTAYVSVLRSGQIFTEEGLVTMAQLQAWLKTRAQQNKTPSLLIRADRDVPMHAVTDIAAAAYAAGFVHVQEAAQDPTAAKTARP